MNTYSFEWNENGKLVEELMKPITSITAHFGKAQRPISIDLVRSDGVAIQIRSKMRDIEERLEVGTLVFSIGPSSNDDAKDISIFQDSVVLETIEVLVLVYSYAEFEFYSGIILKFSNEQEFMVVCGDNPYTLTFSIDKGETLAFPSEYQIDNYKLRNI
ncbi:hypothetical protein [Labrenzia sp. OB1]|uniref:hypothetical protein n=1 Tax=Labrenzia sp. OB1 TaxID=1561204 RepID=UPI0007B258D5|nr:hypothetical protein [Labrenzia sp. OB1]KZM47462.1 hypothetical protein OA90_25675 [Labrenzia sp. OB1]